MMEPTTLATEKGFAVGVRAMRTAAFLAHTEGLVLCAETFGATEPQCPKAGSGRPAVGLARMLPMVNLLHGEATRPYGDSAYRGEAQRQLRKDLWASSKLRYGGPERNANRAFAMMAVLGIVNWGHRITEQVRPA